jgi:peptidoglycan/xylan/chitin deacetylase (PgdA/CDA1 family)
MKHLKLLAREALAFFIKMLGIPLLIRETICRYMVTIIVYHNPEPKTFRRHIEYLSKHYKFIPLYHLVNSIQDSDWSSIPSKALVITIDDGYRENYDLLEIIRKYDIKPTIYLCSNIVNTNRRFWSQFCHTDPQKLKKIPYKEMLSRLNSEFCHYPEKEYSDRSSLNLLEINRMLTHVSIGSHSKFHPILTNCEDEKCNDEILVSKYILENLLKRPIKDFAFPNGDYGDREVEVIKKSGYISARTLDVGWNGKRSDPFRLKAMAIQDNGSINILCGQVCGLFGYLRYLRHGSFKGIHPPFV